MGYTLIELMLVAAIIGLLAAIAIPKFSELIIKAKEASTLGKFGSVRSALGIYYVDNEGLLPKYTIYFLTEGGKYLDEIPYLQIPTVPWHYGRQDYPGPVDDTAFDIQYLDMDSSFAYALTNSEKLVINCTHRDTKGIVWSTY